MPAILFKLGGLGVWGGSGWSEGKRLDSCSGVGSFIICVHDEWRTTRSCSSAARHFGTMAAGVQKMVENTQHGLSAWST